MNHLAVKEESAQDTECKAADLSLRNWGRFVNDEWLKHHLKIATIPTGEGYMAPTVAYDGDDIEPVKMPVDHFQGRLANHVVSAIRCEVDGIDAYRVLVRWYTRLIFIDCRQTKRIKNLSKFLHCAYPSAERMLLEAQMRFADRKKTIDGLLRYLRVV